MTPLQKLKWAILERAKLFNVVVPDVTAENVDVIYDSLYAEGELYDAKEEIRHGEIETGLPCDYSRHYESDSVAVQIPDGSWVGWTYWHGGGKHGEPSAMDWMDDAYDVTCNEEEKMTIIRIFSKP